MGFLTKIALLLPLFAIGTVYIWPELLLKPSQIEALHQAVNAFLERPEIKSNTNQEIPSKINKLPENADVTYSCLADGEMLITKEQLSLLNGATEQTPLYLAFLGIVYDVDKGRKHYGPGGSYSMFAGKDASRAYVTGDFVETELTDDLHGLEADWYSAVREWQEFYDREYKRVGVVIGAFYDEQGCETEELTRVRDLVNTATESSLDITQDDQIFPPCNTEWDNVKKQTRFWCTSQSGGEPRDWIGVPRKLYIPDQQNYRCACVKDQGPPSVGSIEYENDNEVDTRPKEEKYDIGQDNIGDLRNNRLEEYENCDPKASECVIMD